MACHYCGTRLPRSRRTRDHIIPMSVGGLNVAWNITRACADCNSAKADQMPTPEHLAECDICTTAVARWQAGERGTSRSASRWSDLGRLSSPRHDRWRQPPHDRSRRDTETA